MTLDEMCILNVSEKLHEVVRHIFQPGKGFSHYEVERFCRAIDAVADGLEKTFPSFDRTLFWSMVYQDKYMDIEAARMENVKDEDLYRGKK